MQTFLPYPDFNESARVLDPKRLGNQFYREGLTLLRGKWQNHPASRMWRDYPIALCDYLLALYRELDERGYHYPHHRDEICHIMDVKSSQGFEIQMPPWVGDPAFHAAHRSNLLRKDPEWYGMFGWTEPDNLPYIWPV